MQDTFIFTEAFNCGKILKVALESFHKYHDLKVHIFGRISDFQQLGEIKNHQNNIFIHYEDANILKMFDTGHAGTAFIFAKAFSGEITNLDKIIHFDSDIVFKKESISLIENEFASYDIIGSRRCYVNNPGKVKVREDLADTISTYFLGMKRSVIPKYEFEYFRKMCQGVINPLNHNCLDFFDPVTFVALKNGAKIKYLDSNLIGGQDENGSKVSNYKSNMHLDLGSHLAHFGGVGSGYSYYLSKENKHSGYGEWALGRYSIYSKLFYNEDLNFNTPTKYDSIGRWIDGNYDENIYETIKKELFEI